MDVCAHCAPNVRPGRGESVAISAGEHKVLNSFRRPQWDMASKRRREPETWLPPLPHVPGLPIDLEGVTRRKKKARTKSWFQKFKDIYDVFSEWVCVHHPDSSEPDEQWCSWNTDELVGFLMARTANRCPKDKRCFKCGLENVSFSPTSEPTTRYVVEDCQQAGHESMVKFKFSEIVDVRGDPPMAPGSEGDLETRATPNRLGEIVEIENPSAASSEAL